MTVLVAEPQEYRYISSLGPDHDMFEVDEELGSFYVMSGSNLADEAVVSGGGADRWYVYEGAEYTAGSKLPDAIAEQLEHTKAGEQPPVGFRNLTVGDISKLLKNPKRKDLFLTRSEFFRDMLNSYKDLIDDYYSPTVKLLFKVLRREIAKTITKHEKDEVKNPQSKTKAFTSAIP